MPRPLPGQVVVITGASSGIGRASALMLARHGATVVLVARDEAGLRDLAREIESHAGTAMASAADVSDPAQLHRVAEQTAARFGRIDTWVNGAAVATYGTVEQMTIDEMRRVIEVNLLGTIYGSKAALPYLRQTRGTLINISSIAGKRSVPLQASYCAAKHGIIGFDEALRMELAHEDAGVSVTTILPSSINTPFFVHARSKIGVLPQPIPPVYQPEAVAEAVVWATEHPMREIVVGGGGKVFVLLQRLSPALFDWLLTRGGLGFRLQESGQPDDGADNLFAPIPESNAIYGQFGDETIPGNGYTKTFEFHPWRQRMAVAAVLLALAGVIRWRRKG